MAHHSAASEETCRSQFSPSGGFWAVKAQWQAPSHDEPSCKLSVHYFFAIPFYVYGGCFAVCMPVHRGWCPWRHHIREHGISWNWSYMWTLGIEPGSLEKHLVFLALSQLSIPITLLIIVFKGKLGKWFTKKSQKTFLTHGWPSHPFHDYHDWLVDTNTWCKNSFQ